MDKKSQAKIFPIFLISILLIGSFTFFVMAITFDDTVATGSTDDMRDGMTWNHDITCGDDMVLIVGISVDSEPTATVNSITYNDVALTLVKRDSSVDEEEQAEMWNLTTPSCGASYPIVVTYNNPTKEESAGISAVYYGVDYINLSSVTSAKSDGSTSSTLDVITQSKNNWIVNVFALDVDAGSGISVSGDNATQRGYVDQTDTTIAIADGNDSDGTVTMGWSGFNDEWVQIGVELIGIVAPDTTKPTYSNNQTNSTIAGQSTLFSIQYDDNTALNPNGQWIFSTNNTGEWANESLVNFTDTPNWANVTKTLNSTVGLSIGYRWYADDNVGNINNTGVFSLITVSDQCSPILNQDWNISDTQVCDAKNVMTGTGSINILSGGLLYLINSANISTTSFNLQTTGDQIFINSGSEIQIE